MQMAKRQMLGWIFLMLLTGCGTNDPTINIRYDHIHGLTKGSRVIFEGNHIGDVDHIVYVEKGYFDVTVVFLEEYASSVTEHSRFFITDDPEREKQKAVEMIHLQEGGRPLESGTEVTGTTKTTAFFDQMGDRFEKGMERFSDGVEDLSRKILKETQTPEFKALQREFEQLMEEMKRSGEAAHEKIEKDLIPRLKEELKALKKQLEELRREEQDAAEMPTETSQAI
jgi:ElaB/YqjD/DUF883 family membrane-anchored ribosome-binding protein